MGTTITIKCANCSAAKDIDRSEYNYQVSRGRENFFCSRTCSAQFNNQKNKRWFKRIQVCEYCQKSFETESHYEVRFCSRECASAGSITEYRRQKMSEGGHRGQQLHPGSPADMCKILKTREGWKYEEIKSYLDYANINYEFEYLVDKYVFDLALFDYKIFIEFDSDYHLNSHQQEIDKLKRETATKLGWSVIHIDTDSNAVLPSSLISSIIQDLGNN